MSHVELNWVFNHLSLSAYGKKEANRKNILALREVKNLSNIP